jgi:flagellar basal body rod protein FlgF
MDDGFYFAATAMDQNIRRQETSAENLAVEPCQASSGSSSSPAASRTPWP